MKSLKFKYAAAWNFGPFGPEGIEIIFSKYKNIILIRGINKDAKAIDPTIPSDSEECRVSSNGSGKSSIQEIISYGLFGKTVKTPEKIKKDVVVHNKVGKDCKIEIILDGYRIVRTRCDGGNPDKHSLRFWKSNEGVWNKDTECTVGSEIITQKEIEKEIGLSYDAFINMAIFTDDQRACFLECANTKKKEIVENLLSLSECREWSEKASKLRKEIKSNIESKSKEYQLLLSNKDDAERRLLLTKKKNEDWKITKSNEISNLEKTVVIKTNELGKSDNGAALLEYQEAQSKIKSINEELPGLETQKENINKNLTTAKNKDTELRTKAQKIQNEYSEISSQVKIKVNERKVKENEIAKLKENIPGTQCSHCKGIIEDHNIASCIDSLKEEINNINLEIKEITIFLEEIGKKSEILKESQKKVNEYITQFNGKISQLDSIIRNKLATLTLSSQVKEPKADNGEFLLQQQIENLNKQIEEKRLELNGKSPFQDILDNDIFELKRIKVNVSDKEREVKDLEEELPYYDYWIQGFGENGIRKWIIDGIIPELNNRINYWLQFLIDNKITLKFDNQLNETIERNPVDGDPYVYHAMSTGQRRRLNLAVSQSFAHIMTISSGSIPSIVFLDEVSTNVDPLGVQGIYNMVMELAEDKQVFITTHDPDLIRMLEGADTINLIHENGFTLMV